MSTKQEAGYSLIIIAVVIVLAGIVTAGMLTTSYKGSNAGKSEMTLHKLHTIRKAVEDYNQAFERVPCPADGTQSPSSATFGVADATANCSAAALTAGTTVAAGVVPVRTLQLSDDYMFDGWGRRISYAVDIRATDSTTYGNAVKTDGLDILNSAGGSSLLPATDADDTDTLDDTTAIVVLISHGPNGHGAYPGPGNATRINAASASADEMENSHLATDTGYTAYNRLFVQRPLIDGGYDDTVVYVRKRAGGDTTPLIVAVGYSCRTAWSDDNGATWTAGTVSGTCGQDFIRVAHNRQTDANMRWVAVTWGNRIAVSNDGKNWTTQAKPAAMTANLLSVEHNGLTGADGRWVIADEFGNLAYSNTAASGSWTVMNLGTSVTIWGLAHNNKTGVDGLWVLAQGYSASDAGTRSSANGSAWSARVAAPAAVGAGYWFGVTNNYYGDADTWVSVGVSSNWRLLTSANGTTWTVRDYPNSFGDNLYSQSNAIYACHNGRSGSAGLWMVTDYQERASVITSPNGVNWTEVSTGLADTPSSADGWEACAYAANGSGGFWLLGGHNGVIRRSANLSSWTSITWPHGTIRIGDMKALYNRP